MIIAYPVEIESEPARPCGYVVTFPDLPEAIASGFNAETVDAAGCLDIVLSRRICAREDIPPPSEADGRPTVQPSALVAVKAMLYMEMHRQGISQAELARRLGKHREEIDGLLSPARKSSLPLLEKAMAAVGRRLVVTVE